MATSRSESELQFNGTSAADFLLMQSPFAKNWPSTCKQSFPSRSPQKTKKHIGGGNWSLEGFRELQCPLRVLVVKTPWLLPIVTPSVCSKPLSAQGLTTISTGSKLDAD